MLNKLVSRTLHFAETMSQIPNAPYLHGALLREILKCLSEMGIKPSGEPDDFDRGIYALDDYCLYVRFKRGHAVNPILVDSHLDHPSFVLDGRGEGIALGSIGFERVQSLLKQAPIDLRIFGPSGDFLAVGKLVELDIFRAKVETPIAIPANSHGLWDVVDFKIDGGNLLMHSADNMIATDIMLALIEQIAASPMEFPDLDVTFVFTFLEEVFEVSATRLAMKRQTPFGALDNNWIIIVLEAMEAVPLPPTAKSSEAQNLRHARLYDDNRAVALRTQKTLPVEQVHPLYHTLKLPLPDPNAGIVVKVNDFDCVYGYEFAGQPNLAESLLLSMSEELGIKYQHTLYGGACNGTAFSLFPTSSHVATLSIPNPFKHNLDTDGQIVPEQVKLDDVEAAATVMQCILERVGSDVFGTHPRAISQLLKETELVPPRHVARRLRAERGTIAWASQWRLRERRYYGEGLSEDFSFKLRSLAARVREPLFRVIE